MAGSFLLTSPVELFQEERTLKQLKKRTSGEELKLEKPTCVDCGVCVSVCAFDALNLVDGKFTYEAERCNNCGECTDVCPLGVELPPHE